MLRKNIVEDGEYFFVFENATNLKPVGILHVASSEDLVNYRNSPVLKL